MEGWKKDNRKEVVITDVEGIVPKDHLLRKIERVMDYEWIINMMTSYFQALGKAVKSLTITLLRNAVLFIPGIMVLNRFWKLNGVIAAQPVVETVLAGICIFMYIVDVQSARR